MNEESHLLFLEAISHGDPDAIAQWTDPNHINFQHPVTGNTALILAVERNLPELVALLLDHGADVTLSNATNETALHVASGGIQMQLLNAVHRSAFPHLQLLQAAWQGNLEALQHLLVREKRQDTNIRNGQGLTPLMLALRDTDLFEELPMGSGYSRLLVVQELLNHNGDPWLCDSYGFSASHYASRIRGPLGPQLLELLLASFPDTQEEPVCDFCPDTKLPLYNTSTAGGGQTLAHIQSCSPGQGINPNRNSSIQVTEEDPWEEAAEVPNPDEVTYSSLQQAHTTLHEMEGVDRAPDILKGSLARLWNSNSLPNDITLMYNPSRHASLPPFPLRNDCHAAQMDSLGLGYLCQSSHSEPNISASLRGTDLLRDIKGVKQHITQRLTSPRNHTPSPLLCQSPRAVRLTPLVMDTPRGKAGSDISVNDLVSLPISDAFAKSAPHKLCSGNKYSNNSPSPAPHIAGDQVLSKNQIYLSMDESFIISEEEQGLAAPGAVGNSESNRKESLFVQAKCKRTAKILSVFQGGSTELHQSERTMTKRHEEGINQSPKWDNILSARLSQRENFVGKAVSADLIIATSTETMENVSEIQEDIDDKREPLEGKDPGNSMQTPQDGQLPLVHITFSEQGPQSLKAKSPPLKQFFMKRKTILCGVPHNVNHSFNVIAQKENEKGKKNRKSRTKSACDAPSKQKQKPLSINKNMNIKSVPLPPLELTGSTKRLRTPQKVPHSHLPGSDKGVERSNTHLSMCPKKNNSPVVTTRHPLTRANTAPDFTSITYHDIFKKLEANNEGPEIYEMVVMPLYPQTGDPVDVSGSVCRESHSAMSKKGSSSKVARSSSANESNRRRKPKRPNSKSKRCASRSSLKHKNLDARDEDCAIEEKVEHGVIVISGTDWQIIEKSNNILFDSKESVAVVLEPFQDNIYHEDLSMIKEATIENSLNTSRTFHDDRVKGSGEMNPNHFDAEVFIQEQPIKSVPSTDSHKRETRSSSAQQEELEDYKVDNTGGVPSCENKNNAPRETTEGGTENGYGFSKSLSTEGDIEQLTDDLIHCLVENLLSIDERESQDSIESINTDTDDEIMNDQDQKCKSPSHNECNKSANTTNIDKLADSSINGSFPWTKGEVLGKGAYGTVYCGLTSQGELIAAKQVVLDSSDPVTAQKEYKKLQEEVDLLKALDHVNIVGYLGTCREDNMVTIFMEFVPGGSIASILRRFGPLQEMVFIKYTKQILQGIVYLHSNRVIHRDIKGNNLMLMPNGIIKLIDFGCAKRLTYLNKSGTQSEMLRSMHGTPY
ncbi:hypothetical protein XENTR_v10024809 [Xenopus tropicalis]|uniref:Mitogen-activated protein kinase kinase kinase 19 n=1 Tax=Xenopus tropicalis TaxID=8364 RepID=A0A6I8R4F4_XENTR|nr:mitogen-activated protein kinase kinase kinase 19 [Xenopus tropicalis]KAE8581492.1 hypothetical protein XENTR_v10024809 [Xenopus tropicalis]KAE8581493.1 hypothetical protein XENTR_v10024809 [Xenopus tropicalis]